MYGIVHTRLLYCLIPKIHITVSISAALSVINNKLGRGPIFYVHSFATKHATQRNNGASPLHKHRLTIRRHNNIMS